MKAFKTTGSMLALVLSGVLLQTGCNVSKVVQDLNIAVTAIDDGLTVASALGVVPPGIAAYFTAGETCIQKAVPILQAGGQLGTLAATLQQACQTAVNPIIPAGTDASLAAKVEAIGTAIENTLASFNITVGALARPATSATWYPSSGDKAALSKIAAHSFRLLPVKTAHGPTLPPNCGSQCGGTDASCGLWSCTCYFDENVKAGLTCPFRNRGRLGVKTADCNMPCCKRHKLTASNNHAICTGDCDRGPDCLANNCSCAVSNTKGRVCLHSSGS